MLTFLVYLAGMTVLLSDYNRDEAASTPLNAVAMESTVEVHSRRTSQPRTTIPAAPTANQPTKYVAVAGDTVSKFAHRFLGANTKANRAAIIALNPSLQQNPNHVTIGKTYLIPVKPKAR